MEDNFIQKSEIDNALFEFLESIYLFEKREATEFGITWDEIYFMQLLKKFPGMPVSEAAKRLKVPDFVASRMITRLSKNLYVKREIFKEDKRVVKVYITELGIKKIDEIEEYNFKVISKQFDTIPHEDIKTIINTIGKLGIFLGLDKNQE